MPSVRIATAIPTPSLCELGWSPKMLWDHPSLLQETSMPLTLVFRRLALLRCPLFSKNIFLELIPLLTLKRLAMF
ncbi:hypothetical protein Celaphus_00011590 [Cervus elaphus hippelaphus]|uniref:Uncharacterized protein n=1 Tax=Cervus elaphus hippelaphus TaxID=46360 RepID=A0A212DFK9_CEREH|nr:hypothetical protein Celaphus_00011590 [Cervus elaphus hippelaphus]